MAPDESGSARFRIELVAALVLALATIVTVIRPDWIELVLRVEPDQGDGALEWIVVGVLAVVTLALGALAARDRPGRRGARAETT